MIRDSRKLLCRLIEEVEPKLKKSGKSSTKSSSTIGLHSVINIPRLTDRPEWENSQLECSYFGKDIINKQNVNSKKTKGEFEVTKGEESVLEKSIKQINEKGGVPNKIILTGK